ncbi:MAG: hypothetical protein MR576_08630 [Firmicutes bacterium]|nr:hypothetical protein [Bacillota bacterium]
MENIVYYAIEKRLTPEDGRLAEHETIVCTGSEIECHYRIKELQKIQSEHQTEADAQQSVQDIDMSEGGGLQLQIDPEYFVVPAEQYDKEHSLNEQRSIMGKFFSEFGGSF